MLQKGCYSAKNKSGLSAKVCSFKIIIPAVRTVSTYSTIRHSVSEKDYHVVNFDSLDSDSSNNTFTYINYFIIHNNIGAFIVLRLPAHMSLLIRMIHKLTKPLNRSFLPIVFHWSLFS